MPKPKDPERKVTIDPTVDVVVADLELNDIHCLLIVVWLLISQGNALADIRFKDIDIEYGTELILENILNRLTKIRDYDAYSAT